MTAISRTLATYAAPAVLVFCLGVPNTLAVPVAGVEWDVAETTFGGSGYWTMGYQFTSLADISVVQLGAYDESGNGLNRSHDVGIWTTDGTLLGSATVSSVARMPPAE